MNNNQTDLRPLSPHLTIYRPQNTSILSIFHRLTGIGLVLSSIVMLIWVFTIPMGPKYFELATYLLNNTIFGNFFLILSLWAVIYHTLTGVRHLIWDTGCGIDLKWVNLSSWLIILGSVALSVSIIFFLVGR